MMTAFQKKVNSREDEMKRQRERSVRERSVTPPKNRVRSYSNSNGVPFQWPGLLPNRNGSVRSSRSGSVGSLSSNGSQPGQLVGRLEHDIHEGQRIVTINRSITNYKKGVKGTITGYTEGKNKYEVTWDNGKETLISYGKFKKTVNPTAPLTA